MTLAEIDAAIAAAKTMPPRAKWALLNVLYPRRVRAWERERNHG